MSINTARGILTGAAIGAALWALGGVAASQFQDTLRERDARACAIDSYGTNVAIAECYTARGLPVPANFDARE